MKITHKEDYRKLRAKEYPAVGDQLDVLWKLLASEVHKNPEAKAMHDKILAVKARYPK